MVTKSNLGRTSLVLFCHVTKNWIIQENRGVWVHPGNKGRNLQLQKLRIVRRLQNQGSSIKKKKKNRSTSNISIIKISISSKMEIFLSLLASSKWASETWVYIIIEKISPLLVFGVNSFLSLPSFRSLRSKSTVGN